MVYSRAIYPSNVTVRSGVDLLRIDLQMSLWFLHSCIRVWCMWVWMRRVNEVWMRRVNEVCMRSVNEMCMRSVNEMCLRSVNEMCMRSINALCMMSINALCMRSMNELHLMKKNTNNLHQMETNMNQPCCKLTHLPWNNAIQMGKKEIVRVASWEEGDDSRHSITAHCEAQMVGNTNHVMKRCLAGMDIPVRDWCCKDAFEWDGD